MPRCGVDSAAFIGYVHVKHLYESLGEQLHETSVVMRLAYYIKYGVDIIGHAFLSEREQGHGHTHPFLRIIKVARQAQTLERVVDVCLVLLVAYQMQGINVVTCVGYYLSEFVLILRALMRSALPEIVAGLKEVDAYGIEQFEQFCAVMRLTFSHLGPFRVGTAFRLAVEPFGEVPSHDIHTRHHPERVVVVKLFACIGKFRQTPEEHPWQVMRYLMACVKSEKHVKSEERNPAVAATDKFEIHPDKIDAFHLAFYRLIYAQTFMPSGIYAKHKPVLVHYLMISGRQQSRLDTKLIIFTYIVYLW